MTIEVTNESMMIALLLWVDPFQPATDWIGACYSVPPSVEPADITDGIGG